MGALPQELAAGLRDRLGLTRAIETGTYLGAGTRVLASMFPRVTTVEVVESLVRAARAELAGLEQVEVVHGSSRDVLPGLVDPEQPTLYWLDGHWSGGLTGGSDDQCPVLGEISSVAGGHPNDCLLIDDARLFLAPPPPPHDVDQWPTYLDVHAAIKAVRPAHEVTVAHDTVVAVPAAAADLAAAFAHNPAPRPELLVRRAARYARRRVWLLRNAS